MGQITIKDVVFSNVPKKKLRTKITTMMTQSNIEKTQTVNDYLQSENFYKLISSLDIDWSGIKVSENTTINDTADLILWIKSIYSELFNKIGIIEQQISNIDLSKLGFKVFGEFPTEELISENINVNAIKPNAIFELDMSDLTGPTNMYLVYPLSWEVLTDKLINSPIIITSSKFETSFYPNIETSTIIVGGREFRICNIQLGKDIYTIQFI